MGGGLGWGVFIRKDEGRGKVREVVKGYAPYMGVGVGAVLGFTGGFTVHTEWEGWLMTNG